MPTRAALLLDRPLTLGSAKIPNRLAMAPMTRMHSPGGIPGPDVAAYYARRAAAGTGLIITEGTYVGHPTAGESDRVPRFAGTEQLQGWGRVVQEVHAAGGTIMPQLWHIGIQRAAGSPPFPDAPSVGPSGIALDGTAGAGDALTLTDIDDLIASFAEAAAQAEHLGFDGVELHGAHGYLIDQFLWERTNQRTDTYGGDPVSRTRFAADIVEAVREKVSADFPVLLRFSQWKADNYDAQIAPTPQDLDTVLAPLARAGVTAFHASGRRYWEPAFPESDPALNIAGWAKKVTGLPAITVGSVGLDGVFAPDRLGRSAEVTGIDELLDRLEAEEFDMVAVGRALLADPAWAQKVLTGRGGDLVPYTKDAVRTLH
ncbi:NADH:flavin oxidoreductase [Nocardiopsis sp. HNM0947]|uniref:NADH:flavin oxidoreductase n=1 Tax=Nocardiopsis coralli TaxID=2772213 RepID=A0ABR9P6U2_9ACTN|nr:NADH:flavin oxidoreductase [Nocardiopsis coralli]MBE2999564.1 NADH:flavin oxidoreductase [Nocardiopsis coralli]